VVNIHRSFVRGYCLVFSCYTCTAKSLRGGIIFCCILLIIAFTLVWIVIGGELFLTVALSDFCVAPEQFIYSEGRKYNTDKDILNYYVECNDPSPFQESFSLANSLLLKAQEDIVNIARDCSHSESVKEIVMGLDSLFGEFHNSMDDLKVNANCRFLNEDYKLAIFSLCYNSLAGLGYQVLFGAILGMLWLIAICQGTLLASRLGRRKMNYDGGQEDPFLPPRDGAATLERYSARRNNHQHLESVEDLPLQSAKVRSCFERHSCDTVLVREMAGRRYLSVHQNALKSACVKRYVACYPKYGPIQTMCGYTKHMPSFSNYTNTQAHRQTMFLDLTYPKIILPLTLLFTSSNALPHFPVIISNRGSSLISQSNVTVPDDLPPSEIKLHLKPRSKGQRSH
ncbi:hypothetical protein BSL78_27889, partial [Apostichopus japonicus]